MKNPSNSAFYASNIDISEMRICFTIISSVHFWFWDDTSRRCRSIDSFLPSNHIIVRKNTISYAVF